MVLPNHILVFLRFKNGNNRNNLTSYNRGRNGPPRNYRENRGGGDDRYNNRRNTNYDRRGDRGGYRRRSP